MPAKKTSAKKISYELDSDDWEESVKMVVMHTMLALYRTGYREINLAGLMLLMGFENKLVKSYTSTFIQLDDEFEEYVNRLSAKTEFENLGVPKDTIWH